MQFLTIAGIINVILNVITVVNFKLGVAGVAIATSVSQYVSAIFVVISLVKTEAACISTSGTCVYTGIKCWRYLKSACRRGCKA